MYLTTNPYSNDFLIYIAKIVDEKSKVNKIGNFTSSVMITKVLCCNSGKIACADQIHMLLIFNSRKLGKQTSSDTVMIQSTRGLSTQKP